MRAMANRAYLSVWCRDFDDSTMVERLQQLLETVPLSVQWPGFLSLTVRALSPAEAPLSERDLRASRADAGAVARLAAEYLHADCACEIEARWDLWTLQDDHWKLTPEKLEIFCLGEAFDEGAFAEHGHFWVHLGFEHLFTGHAGLLTGHATTSAEDPAERSFLLRMSHPDRLRDYRERTRDNIRRLLAWRRQIEQQLPVERLILWSEGEENFEAKLEAILVQS